MSRLVFCGALAWALCAGLGFQPVLASTVVVPDDSSTVQLAIDSDADTVLIRAGTYPERPVVDHAVVLQGLGTGSRPRLGGMDVFNSNFWAVPPLLSVNRVDFTGRVEHTTLYVHPRNLQFSFSECSLDSGFYQVLSTDPDNVAMLTIRNCHLGAGSKARVSQLFMAADAVDGAVAWDVSRAGIQDCWFRGGPGRAIELTGYPRGGPTAHNRIENYGTGIYAEYLEFYTFQDNTILHCGTGIQLRSVSEVTVTDNEIGSSGVGVDVNSCDGLILRNNAIVGALGAGALLSFVGGTWGLVVEHIVVGKCQGDGIAIASPISPESTVERGNTIFANGGSGVAMTRTRSYPITIEGNIGFGNLGWGLSVPMGTLIELGCNDWFGNRFGTVSGVIPDPTDLSLDPLFCGVERADLRLDSASPLLNIAGCGQIGALGVGCGVTATLVQRFTAERGDEGIRVVWEVAEGATASEVWSERSEGTAGEGWMQPVTERSIENRAVVELDRGAVSDRAYGYRLMAREGSDATVIGPPIIVEAQARPEFRRVQVGPNPGSGAVRIAFALRRAAPIEIDVFDVQGRSVASPGRGVWPSGTHMVEWDGRTRGGEAAPAGLYLVRYVYPSGQDRRHLVRLP